MLQQPTLVLNRHWQPVNVATVARALALVWNDTPTSSIRAFPDVCLERLGAANAGRGRGLYPIGARRLRVPEVVTLTTYDRLPATAVAFSRRNIFKRDHYTCQYLRVQPGSEELTIDHVVPRSHGGQSTWENCVLACIRCNMRKADRTPEQAAMHLKHRPIRPHWQPAYAHRARRIESWSRFVSEAYWNIELQA